MADQATKSKDTAAVSVNGKTATAATVSGTPAGIDWESDANPYKKRFAGEQRAKTHVEQRLAQAEQGASNIREMVESLKRLENRIGSVEDLAAELHDGRGTALDEGDDDGTRRPGPRKVDEVRQRRAHESHVQRVNRVHAAIQNGWVDGMNASDPRMAQVKTLYDGALSDPSRTDDLLEALTIFNTVANEARAASTITASAADGAAGKGTKEIKAATEPEEADTDDTDDESEEPVSPRERIAKSGATAGQGAEGRAPSPSDRTNLRPYELFARSNRGEGYKPPAR